MQHFFVTRSDFKKTGRPVIDYTEPRSEIPTQETSYSSQVSVPSTLNLSIQLVLQLREKSYKK